jgi:hypothetical protein
MDFFPTVQRYEEEKTLEQLKEEQFTLIGKISLRK